MIHELRARHAPDADGRQPAEGDRQLRARIALQGGDELHLVMGPQDVAGLQTIVNCAVAWGEIAPGSSAQTISLALAQLAIQRPGWQHYIESIVTDAGVLVLYRGFMDIYAPAPEGKGPAIRCPDCGQARLNG